MAKSVREIDRDENIYVGVKLPLDYNRVTGFFNQSKTIQEQSKSNLINLLLTSPGERVFQPTFGSNLRSILFDSFDAVTSDNIDEAIREAVARQLPYITINEVNTIQDGQNENSILVSVEFSTTLEPDALDTLTLQFNIGE
tara:strand:+ start:210 stop:632 length:423 start_codon:yes stop_codon:yes gene_type:complete